MSKRAAFFLHVSRATILAALFAASSNVGCVASDEGAESSIAALNAAAVARASTAAELAEQVMSGELEALGRVEDVVHLSSSDENVRGWSSYTLAPLGASSDERGDATAFPSERIFVAEGADQALIYVDVDGTSEAIVAPEGLDVSALRRTLVRDLRAQDETSGVPATVGTLAIQPSCCGAALTKGATTLFKAIATFLERQTDELVTRTIRPVSAARAEPAAAGARHLARNVAATTSPAARKVRARGGSRTDGVVDYFVPKTRSLANKHVAGKTYDGPGSFSWDEPFPALVIDSRGRFPAHIELPRDVKSVSYLRRKGYRGLGTDGIWVDADDDFVRLGFGEGGVDFYSRAHRSLMNPNGSLALEDTWRVMDSFEANAALAAAEKGSRPGRTLAAIEEGNLVITGATTGGAYSRMIERTEHLYCAYPSEDTISRELVFEALLHHKTLHPRINPATGVAVDRPVTVHVATLGEKERLAGGIRDLVRRYPESARPSTESILDRIVVEPGFVPR